MKMFLRFGTKAVLLLLFLTFATNVFCAPIPGAETTEAQKKAAAYDLIKRILPKEASHFVVEFIPKKNNKDVFEIESKNGKIILRGNHGISVASALNYYLKYYAHCDITWNGTNLNVPKPLPKVAIKVRKETPYQYRYYLNYCTFNYTMSWWNWDRWQQEIDWMALNGINMPLAVTGQNSIWRKVYRSMGLTDKDLEGFFSGPAYFNWFWMGNLDAWGGPLPVSWMKSHEELEKMILQRERSLGMTPVLPAFTGHVPPAFKDKYPDARLRKTSWNGKFPDVYLMDPSDPMFVTIGKKFIEEQTKTFGTDHLYSADTFNENTPPTNDSLFLSDVSKKVYQSMAAGDAKATWIMQGWLFHFSAKFWKPTQMKALLNAIPNDKMIILDLWSEKNPVWNRTDAYYGKPWIWCMLHNFGGNISMYGRMKNVANDPAAALHNPAAGKLQGIGLTPEGIEQNPVMYELMLENVWNNQPVALDAWLKGYAWRRYGKQNKDADAAWQILKQTVYSDSITSGGSESIITGRPTFNKSTRGTTTSLAYNAADLLPAWRKMINASDALKGSDGFQYDVVDVTRQVMANYAAILQQSIAQAYAAKDSMGFKKRSDAFITLISDMDQLLATRKDFLLGRWLNAAKGWGTNENEKRLYEKNARNLITLWGDKNSTLREYACKQWAGMLDGFYKPRWQQFFKYAEGQLAQQKPVDEKFFDNEIKEWEWQWVNSNETYSDQPAGDAVATAKKMYQKYFDIINKAYGL